MQIHVRVSSRPSCCLEPSEVGKEEEPVLSHVRSPSNYYSTVASGSKPIVSEARTIERRSQRRPQSLPPVRTLAATPC
jgi:hypothetical protein